jgi:hypothetical protein
LLGPFDPLLVRVHLSSFVLRMLGSTVCGRDRFPD